MTRYYRLDRTDGGPLPEHPVLRLGAIIKVPRSNSSKPGAVFNSETMNWVSPIWVECDDPTAARHDAEQGVTQGAGAVASA